MSQGTGPGYRSRAGGGYNRGSNYTNGANSSAGAGSSQNQSGQSQSGANQGGSEPQYDPHKFYQQVFNHKRILKLFGQDSGGAFEGDRFEDAAGQSVTRSRIREEDKELRRDPRTKKEEERHKSIEEKRRHSSDFESSLRSDSETESRRQVALVEALREARRQTEEEGGAMLLEEAVEQEEQARREALDPPKRWFPVATEAVINEIVEMELARSAAA